MKTGENEMGLKKILDMTRMFSIILLLIHFYITCYGAFAKWDLTYKISDRILLNIQKLPIADGVWKPKLIVLGLLSISLMGAKGRKTDQLTYRVPFAYSVTGLLIYFASFLALFIPAENQVIACVYMISTAIGYMLVLTGGSILARVIKNNLSGEVSNKLNETFPQEERLLENEYSINLPATYQLKKETRKSWINFINPRRGVLILGSPGSGKSYFVIENFIRQMIEKQYALFIYDFKYPDLTIVAYAHFQRHKHRYKVTPEFIAIDFAHPGKSAGCNPLAPSLMNDILDALEASRTMLLSINKTWANKQGEFFVESPVNFLAAIFWFLRKYEDGKYCTLPHAIELLQLDYDKLFTVLNSEPEIHTLINPFVSAYISDIMETVESQIASVRIPLSRLASPQLYHILSRNDVSLDINNPNAPKIFCLGNDPLKSEALAPVISLICDRMNKVINQKEKAKCGLVYDEFATIRVSSVQTIIATGRSNDIVTVLSAQDYSQLKKIYSKEEAETIFNMTGNIINGQVSGETAKLLSERFPKIMQDRQSMSINSNDTSVSKSKQLESSIPASTISSLSSGEFVGLVADNPDQPIELKAFHAKVIQHKILITEKDGFKPLISNVKPDARISLRQNFIKVKADIHLLGENIIQELLSDPAKQHLLVKKM